MILWGMEKIMKQVTVPVSALIVMLGLTGPVAATANGLVAHRAVYDLELDRNQQKSGYNSARARLAYEISGSACEGWAISYRYAGQYEQSEGSVQVTDTQSTSWEAGDGSELRVNQRHFVGGSLSNENKVIVKRKDAATAAKGEITMPEQKMFDLSAKAMFPVFYQTHLIGIAKTGKTYDVASLYDGTEGEKVLRVVSFIGKAKQQGKSETELHPKLTQFKAVPSWTFNTSYFNDDQESDEPIYSANYAMYENGVTADLLFDYGTYTLKGKLVDLEVLKSQPCE
jgi:hypothetical protein